MKDFYYILGVGFNCTSDEIKEAYRKLSKKFHPDLNQGDTYFESHFREVQEAYETLNDPDKRSSYDVILKKFKSGQQTSSQNGTYKRPRQQHRARPSDFDLSKTKGTGIKIILVLIALIIGVYVVNSFSHSKTRVVNKEPVVSAVSFKIHKHHKRKHFFSTKVSDDFTKFKQDSTSKITKTPPPVVKAKQPIVNNPKLLVTANNKQPLAVDNTPAVAVSNTFHNNYLYTTYVIPNATGIINMRKFDDYSSPVIETIPTNSQVSVIQKGEVYYKVAFNNYIGFVPKWSLQIK